MNKGRTLRPALFGAIAPLTPYIPASPQKLNEAST